MKQALLILAITLATALAACGGNRAEPVPTLPLPTISKLDSRPTPEPSPTAVPQQEVPDTATPEPTPAPTPSTVTPTTVLEDSPTVMPPAWTPEPITKRQPTKIATATAPPPATAPGIPTETPNLEEPNREPEPTAEKPTREPESYGLQVYRDPEGVFTFSYPADCGRMVEGTGPDGSRVAGNTNSCPGNDGEIDVELETQDLTATGEALPDSPRQAAAFIADTLATLTDDAHRETLTAESGGTLEVVRIELEAWGDERIVVVTAIHVSDGWQATDIIMSYWASGEEDPNWERVLESLRSFSTKQPQG